ncbi:MAG: hypothetical protein K0U11_06730, partial [Gammaproteobacteria bacterium]|nr:hypothetical protein [Gammaproteobacteria bacterium]
IFSKVIENEKSNALWDVTAKESGYLGYGVTHNHNGVDEAVDWTPFMVMRSREDLKLSLPKAVEMAQMGFNAKRILSECFPHAQLGLTADPSQFAVR